jgi:hypothetical protein
MKSYLRNIIFACFMSFWLPISAHAVHDKLPDNQQPILTKSHAIGVSEHSADQNASTEELWLLGSFLVSLSGLIIFVRLLHR